MFEEAAIIHGGLRLQAAKKFHIPVDEWVDLSTGINPNGWPIPDIPAEVWRRLPETDDGLTAAAQNYYQCDSLLPVAGSQAAIQAIPYICTHSKVGIIYPGYTEHAAAWERAGHYTTAIPETTITSELINKLDVLILINPNNPTGQLFSESQLLMWHQQLEKRGGWLIIDEAFIDTTPTASLLKHAPRPGLIILRSLGKFFGLAGIRCGFVFAEAEILQSLNKYLGPWTLSNPTRYIATAALQDTYWQHSVRLQLQQQAMRLTRLLTEFNLVPDGKTTLFQWHKTSRAVYIHQQLVKQGILCRLFAAPESLRFGLPQNEMEWQKLANALKFCAV